MKMWRDLSITTLPSPINAYEQYKPLNGGPPVVSGGGGGKWQNIPGTRSSYSLPHPAHVQSNQRWQHYGERPISHSPSYPHIPSQIANNGDRGMANMRSRPVSMYDMPMTMHQQQPHSFSSFTPQQLLPPPLPPPSVNNNHKHSSHNNSNNNNNINNNNHNSSHNHNNGHSTKNGAGGLHLRQKPGELVRKRKIFITLIGNFISEHIENFIIVIIF